MLNTDLSIDTIDTHTGGEPTRLITGGIADLNISGDSVREKRNSFANNYDNVREFLMKEPRGHDSMFGAVPVSPEADVADAGLFFIDNSGYLDMCGHGTIGYVTAFSQMGQLEPSAEIKIETPAGIVSAEPTVGREGKIENVQIQNVVSFVEDQLSIDMEINGGKINIPVSIIYAGNFFALVDSADIPYSLSRDNIRELIDLGVDIRSNVNDHTTISASKINASTEIKLVEFYESRSDQPDHNVTVFGNGLVDRSPCGTGTCAKVTLLYNKGELVEDEKYHHQSIIGTQFTGRILQTETHNDQQVVVPAVSGSAYITGKHTFFKHQYDPLTGFRISSNY